MSDPLEYMNALCKWEDPPPYDERWAKKLAEACNLIALRDSQIEYLTKRSTSAFPAGELNVVL